MMHAGVMTCRELDARIGDFVAGELGAEARAAFEAHVARCPSCREYVARYRATIRLAKAAFTNDEAPRRLVAGVVAATLAAARPKH
jgi:anti-sigma factor RsiW